MWPDNWSALQVAVRMTSQLNVGFSGVVGFRLEALPVILRALRIPVAAHLDLIDDLRVIEAEFVRQVREAR